MTRNLLALFPLLLTPCLALAEVSSTEAPAGASMDPASNLVSLQVASLTNSRPDGATRFAGIGVRYARTIVSSMIFGGDSLALEGGVFNYRVVNFATIGDNYDVVPVSAVVQYGYALEDDFRPYLYAGGLKNFGFIERDPSGTHTESLSGFHPAFGIGMAINLKGLIARADIGTDMIGAGLAYGF